MKQQHLWSTASRRLVFLLSGGLLFLASPGAADWDRGLASFQTGDYPAAAQEFSQLVEQSPEAHQGHYMLGLSLLQQKQTAAAVRSLERAVKLHGENPDYRLTLAQSQMVLHRYDAALVTLGGLDPAAVGQEKWASFAQLLARSAVESSGTGEAERAVRRALEVDAESPALFTALASLAERRGAKPEQFEALAAAYRLDSADPSVGRKAADVALGIAGDAEGATKQAWYQKASAVALQVAAVAPSASSFRLAGQARMGLKDYPGARAWFEKAAARDPEDARVQLELGRCSLALKDAATALGHLDRALASSSDPTTVSVIHLVRGSTLRHQERFLEAADAYELAGNTAKVEEMRGLEEIRQKNLAYDAARKKCEEKQRKVAELRSQNQDLQGTSAWRDLERQIEEILIDCQQFLDQS